MKLGNPKNTIEVIQKYDFDFQKKFGQNFLIDERVLEKIISAAEVNKDDFVLEIGPGIGTMTQYLAENAREVMAVEIDKNLIPILSDTLSAYDNVSILNADILKVDIAKIVEEKNGGKPVKVVANLPYYITTPIIMGLFESHVPIDSITVMVQKEVADRMQSGPGTKDYGALSLAVQYYAEPYVVANVPPNCFIPRPNVGSAVIRLTRYQEPPVQVKDPKLMFKLISLWGIDAALGWETAATDKALADTLPSVKPGEYERVNGLLEKTIYGGIALEPFEERALDLFVQRLWGRNVKKSWKMRLKLRYACLLAAK